MRLKNINLERSTPSRGYMTQRHELKEMPLKVERLTRKPRILLQHKELELVKFILLNNIWL